MPCERGEKLGTYLGQVYYVAYSGRTDYGNRARLVPLKGGAALWVPAESVRPVRSMGDLIDALPAPRTRDELRTGIGPAVAQAVDATLRDYRLAIASLADAREYGGLDQVAKLVQELRWMGHATAECLRAQADRVDAGLAECEGLLRRAIVDLGGPSGGDAAEKTG